MPEPFDYELLDFGNGRKLERFGRYVLDRSAPQAAGAIALPAAWPGADARFQATGSGDRGQWLGRLPKDTAWSIACASVPLELRLTSSGQVGVFPEQADNWQWLASQLAAAADPPKILNLFAYTGASTLVAAAAGADVVHVDASRAAVAGARRNAAQSGLDSAPIRWIVEDALSFVRREVRRGNRYQGLILDPPSFGRGPRGQLWQIERDFDELLAGCAELVSHQPALVIATCHTTGWSPGQFARRVRKHLQCCDDEFVSADWLMLKTNSGRALQSGMFVRWAWMELKPHCELH